MSNVENLHDHQALACECGSVKYNVLRSGKLECAKCGDHPSLPHLTDGYHSFNELYQHRHALFIALARSLPGIAWRSGKHDDGTMFPGCFIAGLDLPTGTITYHLPMEYWNDLEHANIKTMERAPAWDGHTSEDVVERLNDWNREIVSCKKCGGRMVLGKGLRNTLTGTPDFPGGEVVTVSPGGPGKMIDVLKCEECGHSVSAGEKR